MLAAVSRVSGAVLWANLHLLFWLSLMPFATGWMGENHFAALPTAIYATVLMMSAIAYVILQQAIIASQGPDSLLKKAVGADRKGKVSLLSYVASIPLAFVQGWLSLALMVLVAVIWFVPDKRIERVIRHDEA